MNPQLPQSVSAETAQRLLSEFLAAKTVIEWLKDKKLLDSEQSTETLAKEYAGRLNLHREFLDQFQI
ncbi:hypothetical protein ACQ4M3_39685 [Leptolyngbya sp. AN03gr2]|uniref:hypothetical protein n=1 Tax=unclassified Leptolyngbya TaxID=2650499 RepID=UPI003D3127EF